jgi:2-desacetyl-2-hydroxyethyl bacteriochlorophyllide A dehydrogenase
MTGAGDGDGAQLRRHVLYFTAPGRVEVRDEPLEAPGPGHVLVENELSALSAGTELLAFRGDLPADLGVDETLGALANATFRYPFRYGYASVGVVTAVGPGVTDGDGGGADDAGAWVGRRVFAFQPHASAFVAPVADLARVPDGLPAERAVLFPHMETAVNLILDGSPGLGDAVLVLGQGVIGLLATALLARFPLSVLAAVEPVAARARLARRYGAHAVVADAAQWNALAGARGADLVYELSGNPHALDLAIAVAGHEARIVVGSWYGAKRAPVDLGGRFHRRRLRIASSQVSHIGAPLSARWDCARRREAAWRALADIDTTPLVGHRVPFADAQRAYDLANAGGVLADAGAGVSEAPQILLAHGRLA